MNPIYLPIRAQPLVHSMDSKSLRVYAPTNAPQYLTISIVDGNTTAIDTLTVDDSSNDSWYTIDGLQLNGKPQRKGLYINNGKKVYINNNK